MAEQIKFTQLPNVGDLTASAIIALAQAQGGDYASYSASLAQIAELLNKGISYEELPTEAKDILGAITEIYNSGGGGGGSNVTMNDNTEGGVDLTVNGKLRTLATQADLEEIAKLGGNYKEVVLYDNPDGIEFKPNSPQTIQLPESYKNFHALYITASASNTSNYRDTTVIPTSSISVEDTYYINTYSVGVGYSFPTIRFTSENEIYLYGFDSDTPMKIYKVVGIKYGGAGGSSVAMSDNPTGGVDISIDDNTKTLATQKDLDTLYKITQGQSWDFVDQTESGMNIAPKGTERQSLIDVRGHSIQGKNPTPDNPQPITSVEQLNFKVTGKNLFPVLTETNGVIVQTVNGSNRYGMIFKFDAPCFVRAHSAEGQAYFARYAPDTNTIGASTSASIGITVEAGQWFAIVSNTTNVATAVTRINNSNIQIEFGTEPTAYEPYREETHTITPPFALNKIGEYADFASIESGEWVKNYNYVDLGSLSWTKVSINPANGYYASLYDLPKSNDYSNMIMSKLYKADKYNVTMEDKTISGYYDTTSQYKGQNWLYIRDTGVATVADLLNLVNGENAIYLTTEPTQTPIEADDLEYLKSLQNLDGDNVITITDQNGNDISYLMKYLVKLSEAI